MQAGDGWARFAKKVELAYAKAPDLLGICFAPFPSTWTLGTCCARLGGLSEISADYPAIKLELEPMLANRFRNR
jgi:hypothetical protein